MAEKTFIHDPRAVLIVFAGIVIKDLLADEFYSHEEGEGFGWTPSVSGGGVRNATNDTSAEIKIKLLQGSPHNKELRDRYNLDRAAPNGAGVGALSVKDANGTELYSAEECWITKPPPVSFKKEASEREWTLRCAVLNAKG
jgi:hypothetical protein